MTVTVGYDPRARRRRGSAAALLNLSGLGLGYLYLRLWGRAVWYWLFTALLIVLANALNAADSATAWLIIYGLWLVLAAYRGWIHGSKGETATIRSSALAPLAGVLAIALAVTGVLLYRSLPQGELDEAEEVHAEGRCEEAIPRYERAAESRYEFTLSPALADARAGIAACELLLAAEDAAGSGDFTSAVAHYEDYLRRYAGEPPFAGAEARLIGLRLDEADALAGQAAASGAWEGAGGYLEAFEAYFALRADHPGSEEAGQTAERVEGMYVTETAAFDNGRFCEAIDGLRPFTELAEHFDEPEARDIDERAERALPEAVYGCGSIRYEDGRFCQAAGEFREAARLPGAPDDLARQARTMVPRSRYECGRALGDPCEATPHFEAAADSPAATDRLAGDAESALRGALFDCGERAYEDGAYEEARQALRRLVDDYPGDARAGEAQDLLIAIEIAEVAADGGAGELPDPSEAGTGAAGVATVEIENGSSETLEILYTGPETGRITIDECSGCAETVTLDPGSYEVVARSRSDSAVVPYYGTWELSSGYLYSEYYYITFY
ncbi:tetratricopeptide repeat protein [Streptomyces sp. 6N223]|uniref:tetratricopeptide repeat protein n=1 Tax=Streptomyces sp. 6N223 TaxID=3457412 RepID=UPI003FD031D4